MNEAAALFGLGAALIGSGVAIHAVGYWVYRFKQLDSGDATPEATTERLARIEQAIEAVAIEVERIGEAQRFAARLEAGGTRR